VILSFFTYKYIYKLFIQISEQLMATVNIPYGGGAVTVNIPDFAMEGTQIDLLEQANRQTDALQKIAQSMGISVQNDQKETKSNKELAAAIKKGNAESSSDLSQLNKSIRSSLNPVNISNAMQSASSSESLSSLIGKEGLLGTLGFATMGAQLGTLFGIMEEFGSSLAALRRTGGGLGSDLMELRTAAAAVGLDMQTLAKITVENGNTIRSLGDSTADGTNQFLNLNNMLRESTREMGFFGMGTREMSAMLVDEIELRRQTRNESFLEAGARGDMVASMRENLKLNEVMAGLTGQDIQDRIKARNEFRRNAIVAAASASMNEEQLAAQNALVEGLSAMGDAGAPGGPIQQALTNLIAGVPIDMANDAFTQLAAAASAEGIDLRANIQDFAGMVEAGADPQAIASASQSLVNQFANIEVNDGLLARAGAGQEGAMTLLMTRQQAFASTVDEGSTVAEQVNTTMRTFEEDLAAGAGALSGMANQIGVATTQLQNTIMNSTMLAFNADVNNPNGMMTFVNSLENLPSSARFQAMTDLVTEIATLASGAQGVATLFGIGTEGRDSAIEQAEKAGEITLTALAVGRALGIDSGFLTNIFQGRNGAPGAPGQGGGNPGEGPRLPGVGDLAFGAAMAAGLAGAFTRSNPLPVIITGTQPGLPPPPSND
jgi:hypothetical protein